MFRALASWAVVVAAAAATAGLVGCGSRATAASGAAATSTASDGEFIAFAGDFAGYRVWPHIEVVDDAGAGDPAHTDTQLVEYSHLVAPSSSAPFAPGTLIVKEGTTGDPDTRQAFAMAKRGGDYNAGGAVGWEWFELQNVDDAGAVESCGAVPCLPPAKFIPGT